MGGTGRLGRGLDGHAIRAYAPHGTPAPRGTAQPEHSQVSRILRLACSLLSASISLTCLHVNDTTPRTGWRDRDARRPCDACAVPSRPSRAVSTRRPLVHRRSGQVAARVVTHDDARHCLA